jgi:hypothetical protein
MPTYHGYLEAYWEQGWEGRIEYALSIEGKPTPYFLADGEHLTVYAPDDTILWEGQLRFVGRGREQHDLPSGIWAYEKQAGVPYSRWIAWFVQQPPLRATVVEDELASPTTGWSPRPLALLGRGILLGAGAGAGLAALYTLLAIPGVGFLLLLTNSSGGKALDALLGFGAFAICAGPFALFIGILPAMVIGALAGLLIGLLMLPFRRSITDLGGAAIGLGVAALFVAAANLFLAPSLLGMEEGTLGPIFLYLFWLAGPGLLALVGGLLVGWRLARCARRAG